ncbi:molybdate ABC transporter substrate-binding protein [Lujinxingia vulgaris]|uniref:molybdate ABC transporter substrate-binding protein n=1 Tax=Lujinxingia vulgaris TaxID=2600176 RepID=UPI001E34ED69|nr:molybdate ABC transporter substrate-binding protein [Lujinxingia vulgaris]
MALFAVAMLGGCEGGDDAAKPAPLQIFVASSLTEVFETYASMYEASNPGLDVVVSAAGSQALRLQIEEGAPADVFVSANMAHLDALVQSGLLEAMEPFASNRLTIITEKGNPLKIESIDDLQRAERLVVGAPEVPIGAYTETLLEKVAQRQPELASALRGRVVSRERNVRQVRAKVEMGEADAAIVYQSDARGYEGVQAVAIPETLEVKATYGLGVARGGHEARRERVEAFLILLRSHKGQEVLRQHGFEVVSR